MEQNPEAIELDSNESLNLDGRIGNWRSKVEILKRMVKFLVSVCVFSLFLSIFSLFPHSFSVYLSTFLFSLLNHAIERKYMFFICNAILFVLATWSSVIGQDSSSSSFEPCSFSHSYIDHDHDQFDHHLVAAIGEQNQEEVEEINGGELEDLLELDEDEGCFTDEAELEELEELEDIKGRELEVGVSTEELNKKIEKFIRKMKEEMRIEAAKTQLIAVYNYKLNA